MLVISGGDSFTFGAELPDDAGGPSELCWANLVSKKLDAHMHINTASSGRSNSFITRRILYTVNKALENGYLPENIFVQIMWTFVARREFKLINGTLNDLMYKQDSEWLALDPYCGTNEAKSDWFKKIHPDTPNYASTKFSLENKYNIYKGAGVVDLGKAWYNIVSDEDDVYTSLKDIFSLQNFLKIHDINHIFAYTGYHVPKQLFEDETNKYVTSLRKTIDQDSWYHFPGDWPTSKYIGFNDWGLINNYEYATSHPLEKAHEDAAEIIYEHIEKIL